MGDVFTTEFIGKQNVTSHFGRCNACNALTILGSYDTTRFAMFFNVPVFPVRSYHMLDECTRCGHRGATGVRYYAKERKKNLSAMMEGFVADSDDAALWCHAIHTLTMYNEESWFNDIRKSYGLRFEANMEVQHLIAQGLCRFGDYDQAIIYCRKAIVLGAGQESQELLSFCLELQEASTERAANLEKLRIHPESARKAYLSMTCIAEAGDPCAQFRKLIHENRIAAADVELSKGAKHVWWQHLVLYCAAMRKRRSTSQKAT